MKNLNPILLHLKSLFKQVRQAITSQNEVSKLEYGLNPKGDQIKWFDLVAHKAVCAYLENQFPFPVELLSEEGTPQQFGRIPKFIVILDPVDGSDNFARGLRPSSMAIALIPVGLSINIKSIQFSLVGDLSTGQTWVAEQGVGAFDCNGLIHVSHITRLEEAMISFDSNHFVVPPELVNVLARAYGIRTFGSAVWSLSMLATGTIDAHIDIRGDLTPENFLAASLIITQAGGMITTPEGKPLPDIQSLTKRYSIVAAATSELHTTLIQSLGCPGRKAHPFCT